MGLVHVIVVRTLVVVAPIPGVAVRHRTVVAVHLTAADISFGHTDYQVWVLLTAHEQLPGQRGLCKQADGYDEYRP